MMARLELRRLCAVALVLALVTAAIGAVVGPTAHAGIARDGQAAAPIYRYDAPSQVVETPHTVAPAGYGATTTTGILPGVVRAASGVVLAAKAPSGATSALQGARLREHLRLTEKYGAGGVRELENGRFRYYGELRSARTPGEMVGQRTVREWDPGSGRQRTWLETLDGQGRTRIVRPETGGPKKHYYFNENGSYGGTR